MNKPINDGGAAFPFWGEDVNERTVVESGMTLRDYFAAQIACGDAAGTEDGTGWTSNLDVLPKYAARRAAVYYAIADAMLDERSKKK